MSMRPHARLAVLFALAAVIGAGCGKPAPPVELFPADGQIIQANGQPAPGGVIEFRAANDARQRSVASVGGDGKFKLSTVINEKKFDGARPGKYVVSFSPRGSGYIPSIELAEPLTLQPEPNHLTIKLPR